MDFQGNTIPAKAKSPDLARAAIAFQLEPDNFQEYLARTVVGWVPMLQDAYTDAYLGSDRIAPIREFIDLGGESLKNGVIGAGYFGPTAKESPAHGDGRREADRRSAGRGRQGPGGGPPVRDRHHQRGHVISARTVTSA